MTGQEIFDIVWDWFVVQGQPRSVAGGDEGTVCLYRGPGGSKCAVGVLVTDEECKEWDRAGAVSDLFEMGMLPERFVPHVNLLRSLQRAHDRCWRPRGAPSFALRAIADEYGLAAPEVP